MKNVTRCFLFLVSVLLLGNGGIRGSQDETLYDKEVQLVSFEDLSYPPVARKTRVQGVVVVKASLADDGSVSSSFAISGSKTLIPDTLSNAKKWRFRPNSQKSAVIVYDFSLTDGGCHDNSQSIFELIHQNLARITACGGIVINESGSPKPPAS